MSETWPAPLRAERRSAMRVRRSCSALVCTVALAVAFVPAAPARAQTAATRWCAKVPLEQAFCPAFTLEAPRVTLRLAVAADESSRERGLMGVRHIPPNEGMLFVFPDVAGAHHEFWMKDTLVPLDMIFVEDDGTVSSVFANVPATKPGTSDAKIARRAGTGRFVIELAAGGARRAGIVVGTRLSFANAF